MLTLIMRKLMQRHGKTSKLLIILLCMQASLFFAPLAAEPLSPASKTTSIQNQTTKTSKPQAIKEKKRELSAFFKIGIALNIAMILTFSWWASRQWRMTAKDKDK